MILSMRAAYALLQARNGYRFADGKLVDLMIHDGLWDFFFDAIELARDNVTANVVCPGFVDDRNVAVDTEQHPGEGPRTHPDAPGREARGDRPRRPFPLH